MVVLYDIYLLVYMWCSLFVSQKWWTSSWCFIRSDFHSHYFTCCKVNFPWFLRAYFLWVYIPVNGYLVICKSLWLYINIYSCQLVFFSIFVWYAEGCRRICLCLGWLRVFPVYQNDQGWRYWASIDAYSLMGEISLPLNWVFCVFLVVK